jgi:hypothetical protein
MGYRLRWVTVSANWGNSRCVLVMVTSSHSCEPSTNPATNHADLNPVGTVTAFGAYESVVDLEDFV